MSVAVKTRPISLQFRPNTPRRILTLARKEFAEYVIPEDEELVDYFETDIHKEISARMKPKDYLREYRGATGMTLQQVADRVGVNAQRVHDWEQGYRDISKAFAHKLADLFSTSPAVFI
jgi:DNA-binding transcriptional regulator YiaG